MVVDFDEPANRYAVLTPSPQQPMQEEQQGDTDESAAAAKTGPQWVPRIDLCFSAEDPFVFARRHAEAHASRRRAESLLRYNLYIDSMPMEDIPPLTSEQVCALAWEGAMGGGAPGMGTAGAATCHVS
jgi:dynein heavy chain